MRIKRSLFRLLIVTSIAVSTLAMQAQELVVPDGRRIRDIVEDKYPDGLLLIGATTGSWAFGDPTGTLMDREFSYVTPENDFKHSVIRANPSEWRWDRADAWLQHIIDKGQVLRMHGPISPQCSNWAKEDNRTAEELSQELDTFMTALCQRYNGVEGIEYLDVVNEISLDDGSWHYPKPGTDQWENPWLLIGQDNDPNETPLYISQAFAIANEHAPDLKQIINNHCHPGTAGMEKVKETVLYLRDRGYRVDGIGWQAHVNVGWETETNLNHLRDVIDWCQERNLEFHVTEFDAWIINPETQTTSMQGNTYKAIMDVLIEKLDTMTIGWNTWHVTDASGWLLDRIPSVFDDHYKPKPAYYSLQLALEAKGDYQTPYQVEATVKNAETGIAIQDAEVSLNNLSGTTGAGGKAVINNVTANRYDIKIDAEHMESISDLKMNIFSDTTIELSLSPRYYNVNFYLRDELSGAYVSGVIVELNGQEYITDPDGKAAAKVKTGMYPVEFTKSGYENWSGSFEIVSDTIIEVGITSTHANVKFRIKEDGLAVKEVMIVLYNDTLFTGVTGVTTFEMIPIDASYQYSIQKENYKTVEDELTLIKDTTIEVTLEKTVADVTFEIIESDAGIEDARIIFKGDTTWFDADLRHKFYDISKEQEYTYTLQSDNYQELNGSFTLTNDTTIVLDATPLSYRETKAACRIYPVPASDHIQVQAPSVVESCELLDISGKKVLTVLSNETSTRINVSSLQEGVYFLRVHLRADERPGTYRITILR